jgi:large subunit ribosomal protein L18
VSTVNEDIKAKVKDLKPLEAAKVVGEALAAKAVAAGVSQVVFDRNGRRYGGRLQALADAARAKGLQF